MSYENLRIGTGFDVHRFCKERPCIIGGVSIEYPCGLEGHSDADVLLHAIIDSLLGAVSMGDIGILFPDSDMSYRNINSLELLRRVHLLLLEKNITIINIDSVIICEEPKIAPHIKAMRLNISNSLGGLAIDRIGIKGKTTETLGFTGRREGIAAQAISLLFIP